MLFVYPSKKKKFPKTDILNSILPLNILFRVIGLIFKEYHIHRGVELSCDERVTLIALVVWKVFKGIYSMAWLDTQFQP